MKPEYEKISKEKEPVRLHHLETPIELSTAAHRHMESEVNNAIAEGRHEGMSPEKISRMEAAARAYKEDLRGALVGLKNDFEYVDRAAFLMEAAGLAGESKNARERMAIADNFKNAGEVRKAARVAGRLVKELRGSYPEIPYGAEEEALFNGRRPKEHIREAMRRELGLASRATGKGLEKKREIPAENPHLRQMPRLNHEIPAAHVEAVPPAELAVAPGPEILAGIETE